MLVCAIRICAAGESARPVRGFPGDQVPQGVAGEDEDAGADLGRGVEVVLRHDVVREVAAGRDVRVTALIVRVLKGHCAAQSDVQPDLVVLVSPDRAGAQR
ncbi:hypothetical protein [Streptomyces sp. SAI-218]|uniref:hypothetical protein n=1 Tax=Streptomyces sp. SAI-218 TaxID=3377736 RepID=UPI003C7EBE4E